MKTGTGALVPLWLLMLMDAMLAAVVTENLAMKYDEVHVVIVMTIFWFFAVRGTTKRFVYSPPAQRAMNWSSFGGIMIGTIIADQLKPMSPPPLTLVGFLRQQPMVWGTLGFLVAVACILDALDHLPNRLKTRINEPPTQR